MIKVEKLSGCMNEIRPITEVTTYNSFKEFIGYNKSLNL
jgi:hypothetical protein